MTCDKVVGGRENYLSGTITRGERTIVSAYIILIFEGARMVERSNSSDMIINL